jgi:hypothetical protein
METAFGFGLIVGEDHMVGDALLWVDIDKDRNTLRE